MKTKNFILFIVILLFSLINYYSLEFLIFKDNLIINNISSSYLQSLMSWLPIIKNNNESIFYIPFLSIYIYKFFFYLFNLKTVIFFSIIIFPSLSFFIIFKILNRQINFLWALSLSVASIVVFSDYPFRNYLIDLLSFKVFVNYQILEITNFPIPSLSVFIFLFLFYLSSIDNILNIRKISIFTFFWSVLFYINFIDFVFGIFFWYIYFIIQLIKRRKKLKSIFNYLTTQILITLITVSPFLFYYYNTVEFNILMDIGIIQQKKQVLVDLNFYLLNFCLPLILTIFVFCIKKIDLYEILIKFSSLYVMMLVEIILVSSNFIFNFSLDQNIIIDRVPLIFLHFYYYVPFIYLVTRPRVIIYRIGISSNKIFILFDYLSSIFFNKLHIVYLPIVIFLFFTFQFKTIYFNYDNFINKNSNLHLELINDYKLYNNNISNNNITLYHSPLLNLYHMIDIYNNNPSYYSTSFKNNNFKDEILKRIILSSKIFNWELKNLYKFLLPGSIQYKKGQKINLYNENIYNSGLGYWLINHNYIMSKKDKQQYINKINQYYHSNNLIDEINRIGITHITANTKINLNINNKIIKVDESKYIYELIY